MKAKIIVNAGGSAAELFLYGTIDSLEVSAKNISDQVKAIKGKVKTLIVRINSDGGSIFEGMAIYTLLKEFPGAVIVKIDGIALSMASVIAMAGKEIIVSANSAMMIHNPVMQTYGESADLKQSADLLDNFKSQLAEIYARKTGKPKEVIAALMDAETWFFGEEAVKQGFADRVTDDSAVAASFDASRFKNMPATIHNQFFKKENAMSATQTIPQNQPAFDAVEQNRIAEITAIAGSCEFSPEAKSQVDSMKNLAILEKQPADAFRASMLTLVRSSRPTGPAIHAGTHDYVGKDALECAFLKFTGQNKLAEKRFSPQVLEAADRLNIRSINDLARTIFQIERGSVPSGDVVRNAFSTTSLPGILGNAMGKTLMDSYLAFPSVARRIAKKLTANDFKQHTGYRLTGDTIMKAVGEAGELQHGTLTEQQYAYSVDTYGRIFGITRQMQKNDDLGALNEIPRMIGRGAALAIEKLFWTLVLANTGSFFGADNGNFTDGASSPLGVASLDVAFQLFVSQVDAQGDPIAAIPKFLVTPPELSTTADSLYKAQNLVVTNNAGTEPTAAAFASKYEPLFSPYLSNSNYPGYSALAWYLFGDPNDIAAFGIAFLDGNEQPIIEEAPQSSDVLGTGWRGYIDFGVCQLDHRGAVKSKGEL